MTRTRTVFIAALVAASQFAIAASANAQSSCKWYAATALKQQQTNEQMKCGFDDVGWHADLGRHLQWCKGVSPDEWKAAAQERDQLLAQCAKR